MSTAPYQVLILVDTSTSYGAEIIRGIDEYSQNHANWLLFVETRGESERLAIPRNWKGDGIIARVTHLVLARQLKDRGVPVVNVSWSAVPGFRIPQVMPDEAEVARLAAFHLLERGLRNFAYCGIPRQPSYTDRCEPTFVEALRRYECRVHRFAPASPAKSSWQAVTIPRLQAWLQGLPKPVGILAWGPERGRNVTDACRACGILVPDEVAVVTTADDELLCGISHPPLSAVDERPRQVGFEAAALMDRLIAGQRPPRRPTLITPHRVVTRRSTDVFAIDDSEVAQALKFIRDHHQEPIGVQDVLKAVSLSRRILEQRFKRTLGRSPAAEIRRVRLARATELLANTDWKISQIAVVSGFAHVEGMNRVFRRELGLTPNQYRSHAPKRFRIMTQPIPAGPTCANSQ